MLPPEAVLRAATRWLRVLRSSSINHAWGIIRADSNFADLTQTQYATALDWLLELRIIVSSEAGLRFAPELAALPAKEFAILLFERAIRAASPVWLLDADALIPDPSELPLDALEVARSLGISELLAWKSVMHVHGHIDLPQRELVGATGERELVALLESLWPGSTTHVSLSNDGFGYDLVFRHSGIEWHIEVKSTTRRGRLVIYLSRHEQEVGASDPNWRLVVVGLDKHLRLQAVATARHSQLFARAPVDRSPLSEWQAAMHRLGPGDVDRGLDVCELPQIGPGPGAHTSFAWLPEH